MWVIDIRHWLDETQICPAIPRLRLKVKKLGEIILYATSKEADLPVGDHPRCWRRPGRKPCPGLIEIELDSESYQIYWECPVCSDEAVVTGWKGLTWDMLDNETTPPA